MIEKIYIIMGSCPVVDNLTVERVVTDNIVDGHPQWRGALAVPPVKCICATQGGASSITTRDYLSVDPPAWRQLFLCCSSHLVIAQFR